MLTQPADQTCTVTDGSGTLAGADVVDVSVACTDAVPLPARSIPTLSAYGLALTILGLVLMGFYGMRYQIRQR